MRPIVLVDNYDSFTYNLAQAIYAEIGGVSSELRIVRNDRCSAKEILSLNPRAVVISPGPGTPKDSGISREIISLIPDDVPILGVCLGHQLIGEIFGAKIGRARRPVHGRATTVFHDRSKLYQGIPTPVTFARYHSLAIESLPEGSELRVTAWDDDQTIMGIAHSTRPLFGVQFHPESFISPYGEQLISNFIAFAQ